jgi:hypothetical protein
MGYTAISCQRLRQTRSRRNGEARYLPTASKNGCISTSNEPLIDVACQQLGSNPDGECPLYGTRAA